MKLVILTGSPKTAGFSTKAAFMSEFSKFGFEEGSTLNATTEMLITNDLSSTTSKMQKATKLGIEVMTYEQLKEVYDLQGDI
jgi:hypothetical protein